MAGKTPPKYRPLVRKGLRDYQVEGVQFIDRRNGRAIIGDPMGLGKTIQAIGYTILHKGIRPALVVCPASLKINWQREIEKWTGEKAIILSGRTPQKLKKSKWYIINYDILSYKQNEELIGWYEALCEYPFKLVIFDEIQTLSNLTNKSKASVSIAYSIQRRILLSGTPIKNCPAEFFTALNIVAPQDFPSRQKYYHRYCDPRYKNRKWTYKGATHTEELHKKVKRYMIRREKSKVLPQLPPKQKIVVPMELGNWDDYRKADEAFMGWLKKNKGRRITDRNYFTALKQQAYILKRDSVIQWIKDFLSTGEKLVVFTYHVNALKDIIAQFPGGVYIDGSVPSHKRQSIVDKFQDPKGAQLLVGQIEAAGVGLTMTAASNMAVVELGWTPADMEQAEDRIHRLTQKAKQVMIYYLIAEDTVEKIIMDILNNKAKVTSSILDGKEAELVQFDLQEEIEKVYKKRLNGSGR